MKNATSSAKTGRNVIVGIYGVSGALGIFCALVPAIGAIIIGICFNLIYAGLIFIIAGAIFLMVQRGLFGYAFLVMGVATAILIMLYRFGVIGDIIAYIDKIKTFSF